MANKLEHLKSGKFRLTIDDFSGGLNADTNSSAIKSNEFATLKNVLIDQPGPARRRGQVSVVATIDGGCTGLAYYKGQALGGADLYENNAYVGVSSPTTTAEVEIAGTGVTVTNATASMARLNHPIVTVDDAMFLMHGTLNTQSRGIKGSLAHMYAGTQHVEYTTGTATFTAGSRTVTGSGTTWNNTNCQVGSFITNTGDSATTIFAYRIVSINSTTSITLDREYQGSDAGSGKSYNISPFEVFHGTDATKAVDSTKSTTTGVYAAVAGNLWGRLAFGGCADYDSIQTFADPVPESTLIVWSGLVGSIEPFTDSPTTPFYGMHGFDPGGYLYLNSNVGSIISWVQSGDAVVVFQTRGITVLYGSPVVDGPGSLDASTVYHGFRLADGNAIAVTPYGLYFVDRLKGLCRWSGSGFPQTVGERRTATAVRALAPRSLGYYRDHLFMFNPSGTSAYMYNIPHDSWVELTGDMSIRDVQGGREDGTVNLEDHYLIGYSNTFVVNISNIIDSPGGSDYSETNQGRDGALGTVYVMDILTGHFGDPSVRYRPEKVSMTYKLVDCATPLDPYITVSSNVGLPGATTSNNTERGDFMETTTAETKRASLKQMVADNMVQVRALQVGGSKVGEIYNIVVEGSVEGEVPSS